MKIIDRDANRVLVDILKEVMSELYLVYTDKNPKSDILDNIDKLRKVCVVLELGRTQE